MSQRSGGRTDEHIEEEDLFLCLAIRFAVQVKPEITQSFYLGFSRRGALVRSLFCFLYHLV